MGDIKLSVRNFIVANADNEFPQGYVACYEVKSSDVEVLNLFDEESQRYLTYWVPCSLFLKSKYYDIEETNGCTIYKNRS